MMATMPDRSGYTSLREWLEDRFGPRGEALYMFVLGFIAISVNGLVAWAVSQPLLFPSLAPTVFVFFRSPLSKDACPRNVIFGHFVAIVIGLGALAAFGLYGDPSVLVEGTTLVRVVAVALSLALTEAVLISLNTPHTPAATTTLLVSLGVLKSPGELISLVVGIALITVVCWTLNWVLGVPVPFWSPRELPEGE
ncbi:MAG: HPP family protein [Rubrobacteraceae bacterium]